jgi:hypothetical protein
LAQKEVVGETLAKWKFAYTDIHLDKKSMRKEKKSAWNKLSYFKKGNKKSHKTT